MNRKQLIKKYIEFFKGKGHKEIVNASLVPENDPTVLFTTAGMHPLVPYLLGQKHPLGSRLVNVQRCIRTGDIDEVGDKVHHTFFEMLGNWSLGDYWKKEAIEYSFEFLTSVLGLGVERIGVSCFKGDKDASKDNESAEVWKSLGVDSDRIVFLGKKDNWWGPAGETGPCGPDTEMFYYQGGVKSARNYRNITHPPTQKLSQTYSPTQRVPKKFDVEDKKWVEIWNDVLMQYVKDKNGFEEASQKNVDTGMGVERTVAVLNGLSDDYLTDCFLPIVKKIEKLSGKSYKGNEKAIRIIADHVKASVFIIGDGVVPSNVERGYVLRRLIRRAVRYGRVLGLKNFIVNVAESVFDIYDDYRDLGINKKKILGELEKEETRFLETLERGIRVFEKVVKKGKVSGKDVFLLYQSYGFPIEMTIELAKEKKIKVDVKGFEKESEKHQVLSRTATEGKFKSGLADKSEETTKLHTVTHLLAEALRRVLGGGIEQKGSNITAERLRFDFNFDRKLTDEEKKKVEDLVNSKIGEDLEVKKEEMSVSEAKKNGAQGVFEGKYGSLVSVYSIGDFSREICAGPHVGRIKGLGKFRIVKEESVAAGVRRIKANLIN